MRTRLRFIVSSVVLAFAVGTPPPSLEAAGRVAAPAPPPLAEMVGTWTGTITPDGVVDPLDGGIIVIHHDDNGLTATVGPNVRARFPANRLAPTERGLHFEVPLEGSETRLLVYDVAILDGKMTGTVTFVKFGLTAPAQLSFARE